MFMRMRDMRRHLPRYIFKRKYICWKFICIGITWLDVGAIVKCEEVSNCTLLVSNQHTKLATHTQSTRSGDVCLIPNQIAVYFG